MRKWAAGYFLAHCWSAVCVLEVCVGGGGEYCPCVCGMCTGYLCSARPGRGGGGALGSSGALPGVFQMWPYWEGPGGWAGAGVREKAKGQEGAAPDTESLLLLTALEEGGGLLRAGPWAKGPGSGPPLSPASADMAPHDLGCSSRGSLEAGGGCGPAASRCFPGEPREVEREAVEALRKPQPASVK